MLLSLILFACTASSNEAPGDGCAEAPPEPGEVRAKQIVCEAELTEGSEAEIGDWLLENNMVKLAIRGATHRLTQLTGTGGTIIDAARQDGRDAVTEIFPLFDQPWPESAQISASNEVIQIEATDGSGLAWEYRLAPENGLLTVEGARGFTMVPAQGAYRTGDIVQSSHEVSLSVGARGGVEDDGGWVHWVQTDSISFGHWSTVVESLFNDAVTASGETDGHALQVHGQDGFTYAFSHEPGSFIIPVPPSSEIRALRTGYEPSEWQHASDAMSILLGDEGFLSLSVTNNEGEPIPASLYWNERRYALPPGTNVVGVGPGEGSGWIDAGPNYHREIIETQTISGTMSVEVSLDRKIQGAALVAIDVPAFPDRHERRFTDDLLVDLASQGFEYTILTASNEIAQANPSEDLAIQIGVKGGSRAVTDMGSPIAFPWSGNRKKPAHGAAPWEELSAQDLLSVMSKAGRRQTIVDKGWVDSAGEPVNWETIPDWFIIHDLGDIPSYAKILDQWIPAVLVGSKTWVSTDYAHESNILRSMIEGKTIATTGPLIRFTINGHGPGSNLYTQFPELEPTPEIAVEIRNAGDIDRVSMIGSGGSEIISWKPSNPPSHYPIGDSNWVLISAEGEQDWAISSPIWIGRP